MVSKGGKLITLKPCILLYNPISGHGHLDSWCALFAKILLERGYSVLVLTPNQEKICAEYEYLNLSEINDRLHFLNWNDDEYFDCHQTICKTLFSQFYTKFHRNLKRYGLKEPASFSTPDMPLSIRCKIYIFQMTLPYVYKISSSLSHKDDISYNEENLFNPIEMGQRVMGAIQKSPIKPDCFLNMYLDTFRINKKSWREFKKTCSLFWGGIKFAPSNSLGQEGYMHLKNFKCVCFLDQDSCKKYAKINPKKSYIFLPDITNIKLNEKCSPLTKTILEKANNRKIVFLGGSIGGQKNLEHWFTLIENADPSLWFFAQIGEVHESSLTDEDRIAYYQLRTNPPENFFLYEKFLENESEFNSIINISSIIFAVYRNFPFSSNMLGKAAAFEKPILVSDEYLMGKRVEKYGIGRAVPTNDPLTILSAMQELFITPPSSNNFAAYRNDFNEKRMGEALETLITICLEKKG